jgi:predicted choloylglycine hydrolase
VGILLSRASRRELRAAVLADGTSTDSTVRMQKRFAFIQEDRPGTDWLARFGAGRAEAEAWYQGTGRAAPPTAADCAAQLRQHMPELLGEYARLCDLLGDDELAHQILSQYRPPPLTHGCTQAVWLGEGGPALIRNYDYPLDVVSENFESTRWFGREVICKAQRPWGGCLDGINADGLVASLTSGGDPAQGPGFAIILVLRYVLETCDNVPQAVAALCRIPVALSQNVTLLDKTGAYATVYLNPDRPPEVSQALVCANHQEWRRPVAVSAGAARSMERQRVATRTLARSGAALPELVQAFLTEPIYSRRAASPTVYSAVYRPAALSVDYLWPGNITIQRIGSFETGQYVHEYGALTL